MNEKALYNPPETETIELQPILEFSVISPGEPAKFSNTEGKPGNGIQDADVENGGSF